MKCYWYSYMCRNEICTCGVTKQLCASLIFSEVWWVWYECRETQTVTTSYIHTVKLSDLLPSPCVKQMSFTSFKAMQKGLIQFSTSAVFNSSNYCLSLIIDLVFSPSDQKEQHLWIKWHFYHQNSGQNINNCAWHC